MKTLFLSALMTVCLASCGGGGGSSSSASNGMVDEIIPPECSGFSITPFQIGSTDALDPQNNALVVDSMVFTRNPDGLGGSVTVTFNLYIYNENPIKGATYTGDWIKERSGDDFAITIKDNSSIGQGSQAIKFGASQLKLQASHTTYHPNGLPALCIAQFTGGDIYVGDNSTQFSPEGAFVQIQYSYE